MYYNTTLVNLMSQKEAESIPLHKIHSQISFLAISSGFRQRQSTSHAVITLLEKITHALD